MFYFLISYSCWFLIMPNLGIKLYRSCVCIGKNTHHSIYKVWYYPQFQASTGGLETYFREWGEWGTTVTALNFIFPILREPRSFSLFSVCKLTLYDLTHLWVWGMGSDQCTKPNALRNQLKMLPWGAGGMSAPREHLPAVPKGKPKLPG